ncbi:ribosomal protein S18-alanine N-acetyltransferase [soil metagenome]
MTGPRIIAMTAAHIGQVADIEAMVSDRVSERPWSAATFLSELRHSDRCYVTAWPDDEGSDRLLGYGGVRTMLDEAHITTVAVDPGWQRRGIGGHLMVALMQAALRSPATAATLEVRATNLAAQRLYSRFGFAPVGVRPRYYSATAEDAIIMWVHDIDTPDYANRLAVAQTRLTAPSTAVRN